MDKKRALKFKLEKLFFGLCAAERFLDALKVGQLKRTLTFADNKPALRAWAVKARRVIGGIRS